jgi:hypothetical protein
LIAWIGLESSAPPREGAFAELLIDLRRFAAACAEHGFDVTSTACVTSASFAFYTLHADF